MKNLSNEFDATVWAKEFMETIKDKLEMIDYEFMHSWFANAIMAGYDIHRWNHPTVYVFRTINGDIIQTWMYEPTEDELLDSYKKYYCCAEQFHDIDEVKRNTIFKSYQVKY